MGKQRIEPLNVVDLHSRYWLCCRPFTDKSYADTRQAFDCSTNMALHRFSESTEACRGLQQALTG